MHFSSEIPGSFSYDDGNDNSSDYLAIIPFRSHVFYNVGGGTTLQLDWSKRGDIKYTKLKIYGCVPKLSSKG